MINVMNPSKDSTKDVENYLDSQLWYACAGGMVKIPAVNSKVFYFPQGHIEHALVNDDLKNYPTNLPSLIPCQVSAIKYFADRQTDEVYAKIRLIPSVGNDFAFSDDGFEEISENGVDGCVDKPACFAKILTQSDANNGGGFSVPRYCAETIFPKLDYSDDPPVQTVFAKDVHGVTWKFRHIYRGTPRRHLLTTGWSNFVNQKRLVAGDSIVFLRAGNGDLCVGIRRLKRGIGGGVECLSGWNNGGFLRDDEGKIVRSLKGSGSNVIEAANLAANGYPFEVVYYPRSSTPEFFVKASVVKDAMQVQWCRGMRFKMAFETEDSSRIGWFMGTVSSVNVDDPVHWPNSPWRLLQVAWDDPELLQNVKRVNPWLVELVATMPNPHMYPLSPPRKRLRLPQSLDFPFSNHLTFPSSPNDTLAPFRPFFGLPDKFPAGIQGARHSQFGHFLSDLHFTKTNPCNFQKPEAKENLASLLSIASSEDNLHENSPTTPFMLFGKPILTEKQISEDFLKKTGNLSDSSSEGSYPSKEDHHRTELGLGIGPCNFVMGAKNAGQRHGLSALGLKVL